MGCCENKIKNKGEEYIQNIYDLMKIRKLKFEKIFEIITEQNFYLGYYGNESFFDKNFQIKKDNFIKLSSIHFYKIHSDKIINLYMEQIFLNICKLSQIDETDNLNCKRILCLLLPFSNDSNQKKLQYFLKIKESDFESICPFSAIKADDRARAHHFIPLEVIIENILLYLNDILLFYSLIIYENLTHKNEIFSSLQLNCSIYSNESYIYEYLTKYIHPVFGRKIDESSNRAEALLKSFFINVLKENSYIFDFDRLRICFITSYENTIVEEKITPITLNQYRLKNKYNNYI